MGENDFDDFPTTDKEVEAWCANPDNEATPEQMLEFYESAYPNLIIKFCDSRKEVAELKAALKRRDELMKWANEVAYYDQKKSPICFAIAINQLKNALISIEKSEKENQNA